MSYKMPKLTDKRKLCPRCGSPLMDKGKYLSCAMCGYTLADSEPKTVIKFTEPAAPKKEQKIKIFQVTATGTTPANTLESGNVYLVSDPAQDTIWLWKGSGAKHSIVYNAGTAATKLKTTEKMYASKLVRVDEGDEPSEFPDITQTAAISKEMVSEAKEAVAIEAPPEGQHNIYLINQGELEKIDMPVFTTGDSYLIDQGDFIWIWIGKNAQVDEKFTAAHLSTVIDVSRKGRSKILSVEQGSEPKRFKALLGGLKIVEKDVAASLLKHVERETWEPILYRISSEEYETLDDIVYIQVPCKKSSLDSEDVFLLDDRTNNKTYIWVGSQATVKEKVKAGQIARKFEVERAGVQEEIFVEEGQEPEEFLQLLKD